MKIRKAAAADEKAVKALWGYCFEKPDNPFFKWYFDRLARPEEVLVGEEAGSVACDLHRRPYTLAVRGEKFPTDYIVGVATHPAARGKGCARELLRSEFHLAAKEDKPFVILMPSAASFYLPLGFGFYVHQWERRAAPERLAPISKRALRARTLTDPADYEELAAIYDAYTAGRSGYALRDEDSWRWHMENFLLTGFVAEVYDEEGPAGYMAYTMDGRTMTVVEMAFSSEAGRRALYAYMAGHQGSIDTCVWYEPLDDTSFRYWMDGAEHTYIRSRTFPFMLARLTDPVAAFDGLPCEESLSGQFAFQLVDTFLPGNSGIYVLSAENGRIRALKNDVFYDLKCHIEDISGRPLGPHIPEPAFTIGAGSLAELFMGSADLTELSRLSRIHWLTPELSTRESTAAFADIILPKQRNWNMEWF